MSILSELQSKKLGFLELISLGYELYLKNFWLFSIFNCIFLPFFITQNIFVEYNRRANINLSLIYYVLLLNYCVFLPLYTATINIIVENCVVQRKTKFKDVVKQISHRILPIIRLSIIYYLSFILRFLLLIIPFIVLLININDYIIIALILALVLLIPAIIYLINNTFYIPALILREQRGKAAFQYSKLLVKGNWWRVFFYIILLNGITFYGLTRLVDKILNNIIKYSPMLVTTMSTSLVLIVGFGMSITGILLFLNLEFQKGSNLRLSRTASKAVGKNS